MQAADKYFIISLPIQLEFLETTMSKRNLYLLTYSSVIIFFGLLLGLILIAAKDRAFALGWFFWFSFCIPTFLITAYFLKMDPLLIERRIIPQETRPKQIIGQSIAAILFGALIIISAMDYRLGWTKISPAISFIADACIVAGFVIVFKVFKQNTYASRAVETMADQKVIKSGIYSKVRHPMYAGAALIIIATPLALGSAIGVIVSFLLIIVIIFRTIDEEKMLLEELNGYKEYCNETKYRLIPFIW